MSPRVLLLLIFVITTWISCQKDKNTITFNGDTTNGVLLTHLTADNAYINDNYYYENQTSFKIEYKSNYDSVKIEPIQGNNAIKFKVNPDTDYLNERAEIRIVEMVPFSEGMKWVSLNLFATAPVQGIIFQCHQFPPNNPPIAIRSTGNGKLYLEIFNDHTIQSTPLSYEIGQAHINEWNRIIIGFQADPAGNGNIIIYFNNTQAPDIVFKGAVGFSFERQFFDTIKFGIYRGRGKQTTDVVYVDEIKYGTTFTSVK